MKAKPFVKWVGGKGQLLGQIEALLPKDFDNWREVSYIEPFVGGGAMLFHILQEHPNISHAVINDINPKLTTCYRVVRDSPILLIERLKEIEDYYHGLKMEEERKEYYLRWREAFNRGLTGIEQTAAFLFLNRTCFNGLYRENSKGGFNVPFGRYSKPQICNEDLIMADSKLLQRVEILTGEFEKTFDYAKGKTLFYLDPPYRQTFNQYTKQAFNDEKQIKLKEFCDRISDHGYNFMMSNSDCEDGFFDELYHGYNIEMVWAKRSVNTDGSKRGKITEILVRN